MALSHFSWAWERGWRIVRQAQPRAGEGKLLLPKDIAIDLAHSELPGFGLVTNDAGDSPCDFLFSTKGGLMAQSSLTGKMTILWLRDVTKPFNPLEGALMAINPRTGMVSIHPPAPGPDPYAHVRDGKSSGM